MKNNQPIKSANIAMLSIIAEKLDELCDQVVFLGGCATALLTTDPFAPDARFTQDIDCIVDVISLAAYYQITKQLRQKGFTQSMSDKVICRWRFGKIIIDVMPTNESILGCGNRWYKGAIENSQLLKLPNNQVVCLVNASYFLATKLEAFQQCGKHDFLASHDLEDIVSVIDGREEINDEIENSNEQIKDYLSQKFHSFLHNQSFLDALAGHLNYGAILEERLQIVLGRIEKIVSIRRHEAV